MEQEGQKRESAFSVKPRFSLRNGIAAGAVLALSAVVLLLEHDLWFQESGAEETVPALWFLVPYAALSLGSAALCLLEVKLPQLLRQFFSWAAVLFMPLVTFIEVDVINDTNIMDFSPRRLFANYLCYLMVFAFLFAVSRRAWVTVLAGNGAFLFFGIVNHFVVKFRGQPILPWDIQAIGTAAEVSGGYKFQFDRPMVLAAAVLLFAVLFTCKFGAVGKGCTTRRFRLAERLCALVLSGALAILIFPCDLLSGMGISVWAWNQRVSAQNTGVMAGFFGNIQFLMVDKPEGYSKDAVEQLGKSLAGEEKPEALGDPGKMPTVIAVMNESMTDLQSFGNLELTRDNLPFLHELREKGENIIWGTAYSSVYGGDTCNSEYEFLTGNSLYFLPSGCKPYQQYVDHDQTALPALMKSYGYECTAIHPGNRGAWQRDTAYPYLRFDTFMAARDFTVGRDLIHGLTRDKSCYRQVIDQYEKGQESGTPQFIFNVTIQNHGGFEDEDVATTVRVKGHEGEWPQAEQYLSLTKVSDMDLEYLIDYFEQREDPVVILFFGDHWPNLETGFLSHVLGTDAGNPDFEALMQEHEVPFFIWANYPLESQQIEKTSLNYLSGLLLRAAGLNGTAYTDFLEKVRQEVPVINSLGCIDKDGNLYKRGDETPYEELLNQYNMLQYNNAFDGDDKVEQLFTGGE